MYKVKLFDEHTVKELEDKINEFLKIIQPNWMDIKYSCSAWLPDEDTQIEYAYDVIFSAIIIWKE